MNFWMLIWLTFKWGFGILTGLLLVGMAQLAVYIGLWHIFHFFFEPRV